MKQDLLDTIQPGEMADYKEDHLVATVKLLRRKERKAHGAEKWCEFKFVVLKSFCRELADGEVLEVSANLDDDVRGFRYCSWRLWPLGEYSTYAELARPQ